MNKLINALLKGLHSLGLFSFANHGIAKFAQNGCFNLIVNNECFFTRVDIDGASFGSP